MPGTQPHGLEGYPPLRKSAFKSFLPRAVFSLAWVFMTPAYLALNWVVSIFRPTTDEIVKFRRLWLPIACIMLIVSVPIALFALPFYILSHLGRRAFTYHVYAERTKRSISKTEWTIVSCNAHLLPEALARKYNLRNTSERAKSLAVRIAASNIQRHSVNFNNVLKDFPTSDFVCMQQVYDRTAVERILFHLHQSFPFIVEDTGVLHWRSHRLSAGSGLMLLSKYPIMDAEFKTFSGSAGADGRFCRGLLLAKVHLFKKNKPEKRRFVGYIFVTELHSSNPDIRRQQLEEIERFTHNFRERTSNPGEVVGFQAIAGEFHFDNVSQVHNTNWEHNLFTRYAPDNTHL
ncbi:hypothetical protein PTSG_06443 [Salpingoeca rosetta]|uniref:Endonuclease/exonuclease/phosphatase domain-containing protein n=1 Tax=Salpingoeca rosetta (strain ATCC 50818 / BSB-021) TaxID=946362 RepID=F2UFT8_SALR5|nr:uncharacterized protein PTSG_06443 [Salpingoeca rosetta]EGD75366.1 hypothetical protein PTSG_06443 [Salpingoeca rosetta]|eukprot:XP_004991823.1 hypothetical protein PTSG_06443 [Salpingoeca rosetta]